MADRDIARALRDEARQQGVAHRRLCATIARAWETAGHDPRRHLAAITAAGDPGLLNEWYYRLRGPTSLADMLALHDIVELSLHVPRPAPPAPG